MMANEHVAVGLGSANLTWGVLGGMVEVAEAELNQRFNSAPVITARFWPY